MPSRCFGAAISSKAAGTEKRGCGCLIQDGGIPVVFCWFFFFSLCPLLASHSCWESIFTHIWVSRYCQVLTATKTPLKTRLLLPVTLGVQETSLPTEQGGKTKGERVISWPAPAIPPAEAGGLSSRPLRGLRIRPTCKVGDPLSFFFFYPKNVVFQTLCKTSYLSQLLTDYKRITGRKHSTQFLNLSCTVAERCHPCLNRNLVFSPSF